MIIRRLSALAAIAAMLVFIAGPAAWSALGPADAVITGGTINNTTIGATTPTTGIFTTGTFNTQIELSHASQNTLTGAAGVLSIEGVALLTATSADALFLTPTEGNAAYQPLDADLTSWAGVTRASGFDTWVATPSSANIKSLVTDETGTGGALVFATDPDISISATTETNIEAALDTLANVTSIGGDVTAGGDFTSTDDIISGDDVLLSNAGVINFGSGDCTLTEGTDTLTIAGTCTLITEVLTPDGDNTRDLGSTGATWATAHINSIELANGTANTLTASAGVLSIEGAALVPTSITLTAGTGLSGGGDLSANRSFALDATEISSATWGAGAFTTFTFDAGATDPTLTFGSGTATLEAITNFRQADAANAGGAIRLLEDPGTGSNYIGFLAPASVTADVTCTLENDGNPIPDSCVGDGTDAGAAGGIANVVEDLTPQAGGAWDWNGQSQSDATLTDTIVTDYNEDAIRWTNDAADGTGVLLEAHHNSGSPADGDIALRLGSYGGADDELIGSIALELDDGATTTEDTYWVHKARVAGADRTLLTVGGTATTGLNLGFDGTDGYMDFHVNGGLYGLNVIATDDSSTGSAMGVFLDTASPADNDVIGTHFWNGRDDGSNFVTWAQMSATSTDVSDGTEDAAFEIETIHAGTLKSAVFGGNTLGLQFKIDESIDGQSIGFTAINGDADGWAGIYFESAACAAACGELFAQGVNDTVTLEAYKGNVRIAVDEASHDLTLALNGGEIILGALTTPDSDAARDLGTSSLGFRDVFITSDVEFNGSTDTTLTASAAGELTLEGDAVKHAGKQSLYVPASAMRNSATSSASCGDTYDSGSNDLTITVCAFDTGATEERAEFGIFMPKAWNESTVTFQPISTCAGACAATETLQYELACAAISSEETMNSAQGTPQSSSKTLQATPTNELLLGAESSAITIANTPAENDYVHCRISRDTSADNMAGDALLIGIKFFWTDNASTLAE